MLEELAEAGLAMAKEISKRMIEGPYHPEPQHDPGRSFAGVSRSVRLTLTLERKVDEQILALCRDESASAEPSEEQAVAARAVSSRRRIGGAGGETLVDHERGDLPEFGRAPARGGRDPVCFAGFSCRPRRSAALRVRQVSSPLFARNGAGAAAGVMTAWPGEDDEPPPGTGPCCADPPPRE